MEKTFIALIALVIVWLELVFLEITSNMKEFPSELSPGLILIGIGLIYGVAAFNEYKK